MNILNKNNLMLIMADQDDLRKMKN